MRNYYDVLGVSRVANNTQIQKAYHGLVKIWHPDKYRGSKLVAQKKLADINKAYETLKNDETRKRYDQENPVQTTQRTNPFFGGFGTFDGTKNQSKPYYPNSFSESGSDSDTGSPFNMEKFRKKLNEINESLAKSGIDVNAPSESSDDDNNEPFDIRKYDYLFNSAKGTDINVNLIVTLEDVYKGAIKKVKIQKKMSDGKNKNETKSITLRTNTCDGDVYTINGAGNHMTSDNKVAKEPGNVIVNITIKEHGIYRRKGSDLYTTMEISLKEAEEGFTKKIKGIDGKMITIVMDPLEKSSDVHVKEKKGMRKSPTGKTFGDLYVDFVVIF